MIKINEKAIEQRIEAVTSKILTRVKELAEDGIRSCAIQYKCTGHEAYRAHELLEKEGIKVGKRGHAIISNTEDGMKRFSTKFIWG